MPDATSDILRDKLTRARELSWKRHGKEITFYLPGMFLLDGVTGLYPAVSITGGDCALQCDHCKGVILKTMVQAPKPGDLVEKCRKLAEQGALGVLLSGGCDEAGELPWKEFLEAVTRVKHETGLIVSVHSGFISEADAQALKSAGVDQALIDVIGSDDVFRRIYHAPYGVDAIRKSLAALNAVDLPIIPHIVCGLDYGKMGHEYPAVEMLADYDIEQLVIVSLMGLKETPMHKTVTPAPEEVADLLAEARFALPETRISLGCARKRGQHRLEELAIDAGINRMALPSDEALARAEHYGLKVSYQRTCCSTVLDYRADSFNDENTADAAPEAAPAS
jgi:hypothetical protein